MRLFKRKIDKNGAKLIVERKGDEVWVFINGNGQKLIESIVVALKSDTGFAVIIQEAVKLHTQEVVKQIVFKDFPTNKSKRKVLN